MLAGVPEAYFQMGQGYLVGSGVPADSVRAYALWQRASQLGGAPSACPLREIDIPSRENWAKQPSLCPYFRQGTAFLGASRSW